MTDLLDSEIEARLLMEAAGRVEGLERELAEARALSEAQHVEIGTLRQVADDRLRDLAVVRRKVEELRAVTAEVFRRCVVASPQVGDAACYDLAHAVDTLASERDAVREEARGLRSALDKYRSCRHACQECFCTVEARAALAPKEGAR